MTEKIQGWRLLPEEPTQDMWNAAYKAQPEAINVGFAQAYRDMVEAAPKCPADLAQEPAAQDPFEQVQRVILTEVLEYKKPELAGHHHLHIANRVASKIMDIVRASTPPKTVFTREELFRPRHPMKPPANVNDALIFSNDEITAVLAHSDIHAERFPGAIGERTAKVIRSLQAEIAALRSPAGGEAPATADQVLRITYTNYRGETSERTIVPKSLRFGSTEWHPEPQWLLLAFDAGKNADREFALKDFGLPVALVENAAASLKQIIEAIEPHCGGTLGAIRKCASEAADRLEDPFNCERAKVVS